MNSKRKIIKAFEDDSIKRQGMSSMLMGLFITILIGTSLIENEVRKNGIK